MSALFRLYPGDGPMALVLTLLAQVTVVLLVAEAAARGLRRRSAPVRYAVWLTALAGVLLAPLVIWAADEAGLAVVELQVLKPPEPLVGAAEPAGPPSSGLRSPRPLEGAAVVHRLALPRTAEGLEGGTRTSRPEVPAAVVSGPATPRRASAVPMATAEWLRLAGLLLLAVWLAGALFFLARLVHGCRVLARLRRAVQPADGRRLRPVMAEVARALNVDVLPPVVVAEGVVGPLAAGLVRPLVVLPRDLIDRLSDRQLADILIHECAHILHRDQVVGLLQRVAALVFWPHPHVHRLNRQLARVREEICDNYVLRGDTAPSYARTLLLLAEQAAHLRHIPSMVTLHDPRWRLEDRVSGLLDERRKVMTRLNKGVTAVLAALFLLTGLAVAGTRLVGAERGQPGPSTRPAKGGAEPKQEVRVYPLKYVKAEVAVGILDGCLGEAAYRGLFEPRPRITSDSRVNALVVAATPTMLEMIRDLIEDLDRPGAQVLLKVQILQTVDGRQTVVSSPQVLCADGGPAEVFVGEHVPLPPPKGMDTLSTYEDVGLKLNVVVKVVGDDRVSLDGKTSYKTVEGKAADDRVIIRETTARVLETTPQNRTVEVPFVGPKGEKYLIRFTPTIVRSAKVDVPTGGRTGKLLVSPADASRVNDGLVLYLPFDGNAKDASGKGNGGEVHGAQLAPDRFGRLDRAYRFNGKSDYVLVPSSPSLDVGEAFTVSAWVATEARRQCQYIVRQGNFSNGKYRFALRIHAPDVASFNTHDGAQWYETSQRDPVELGRWYHLVGVYASGELLRLYIDGSPAFALPMPSSGEGGEKTGPKMNPAKGEPIYIGAEAYRGIENFFTGRIDDVRIYNRALSDRDVAELHRSESESPLRSAAAAAGLLACYPLDGNAQDVSGGGHHGRVVGAKPAEDRFGRPNRALSFNGADDYIEVPGAAELDAGEALTVSAWARPDDVTQVQNVVLQGDIGVKDSYRFGLVQFCTDLQFNTKVAETWYTPSRRGNPVMAGRWYHLVGVTDRKAGYTALYVDGREMDRQEGAGMNAGRSDSILIGAERRNGQPNRLFKGLIDDVRLYNRALTAEEIAQLHQAESREP